MDISNTRKVEVQTFKVILDCTASSRLAWAIKDPVFKKKKSKELTNSHHLSTLWRGLALEVASGAT